MFGHWRKIPTTSGQNTSARRTRSRNSGRTWTKKRRTSTRRAAEKNNPHPTKSDASDPMTKVLVTSSSHTFLEKILERELHNSRIPRRRDFPEKVAIEIECGVHHDDVCHNPGPITLPMRQRYFQTHHPPCLASERFVKDFSKGANRCERRSLHISRWKKNSVAEKPISRTKTVISVTERLCSGAKRPCFVTNTHWSFSKRTCFAATQHCFVINRHRFVANQCCFVTKTTYFMTPQLPVVSTRKATYLRGHFALR